MGVKTQKMTTKSLRKNWNLIIPNNTHKKSEYMKKATDSLNDQPFILRQSVNTKDTGNVCFKEDINHIQTK